MLAMVRSNPASFATSQKWVSSPSHRPVRKPTFSYFPALVTIIRMLFLSAMMCSYLRFFRGFRTAGACGLVPRLSGDPAQQPPKLVLLAKLERAENRPFGAGHLCLQLLELLDAKWGGHHFACTTISGIRCPSAQSGPDQVIDHVRHHQTVNTQVLRKPQLIGDVLANHRVEKLIAARTARQITDARVRMSLVVPHQHPDRPTKVALGLSGTFTNTRTHHTPSLTQLVCHATELFGKQIEHTSGYDPESVPRSPGAAWTWRGSRTPSGSATGRVAGA